MPVKPSVVEKALMTGNISRMCFQRFLTLIFRALRVSSRANLVRTCLLFFLSLVASMRTVRSLSFTRNFEEYCPTPRNPCTMIPLLCKPRAVREIIVSISVSSVDLPMRAAGQIPAPGVWVECLVNDSSR